ncbi:MAG: acyl--CoA ligase [Clostridia bacterium]|nr:acyl--CoA ligase [Clostridia bacterium]
MINTADIFRPYTDAETFSKIVDYDSVSQMWQHSVDTYPNNVAIVDNGTSVTYAELENQVALIRGTLAQKGIKAGDTVGVYSPNSLFFVQAYLAVTTLGACAVLLPAHLDKTTVFGCYFKFGLKALIYNPVLEENLALIKEKNPGAVLICDLTYGSEKLPMAQVEPTAPCAVIFTGGTTGKSKGALLCNRAIMKGAKNGCYGIRGVFEEKLFLVLPLTHVFGLIRNLMTALYTGSSLYICRDNKNMFKEIMEFQPTTLVLVPALAEMALTLSKKFGRNMLGSSVKTIICGAATVAPYLAKEYDKMGVTLLPGYGLTESANLVSGNPIPLQDATSVGFVYPDIEYKIVDDELWIKGLNVMDKYLGDEEENAIAFEDGYFKTGDLVKMNENGMLYIVGRKKEVIVLSSGENVYPAEIENKVYEIDTVQDCLIYEYNQQIYLEILPRMEVVKALGVEDLEKHYQEKVALINETLAPYEKINKIIVRDTDFVRSPAMKILRGKNGKK